MKSRAKRALPMMPVLDVPIVGRACWFCEHVYFSTAEPAWSSITPGSAMQLLCTKGYWEFDQFSDGLAAFRAKVMSAERCADFAEEIRS